MANVVISADSTCDLTPDLTSQHGTVYFPYHIIFRGKDYRDNVDIFPEDIYAGYYEDGSLPTTAAINVGEYLEHFQKLVEGGREVVHLNLGSSLSCAHQNAKLAARHVPGVYVVDSGNLSTGMGLLVMQAGRMAAQGASAQEIVEAVEDLKPRVHSSFVMDTFDFMAAGGRCPQILAWVGKKANLKPQLLVNTEDGSMSVGKMYRGKPKRVLPKYARDMLTRYDDILLDDVFVTHSGDLDEGVLEGVVDMVLECLPEVRNIRIARASCTISSHCGPACLGVLFLTKS